MCDRKQGADIPRHFIIPPFDRKVNINFEIFLENEKVSRKQKPARYPLRISAGPIADCKFFIVFSTFY